MGALEQKSKKRKQRRDIRKALLLAVQGAALLGVAIAAPNVPAALYRLGLLRTSSDANVITRARKSLIKAGLLQVNKKGLLRITATGKRQLALLTARESLVHPAKKWDGRWRVLIFDVPEYRKSTRDKIRRTLHAVGFLRLQDSVWIYPHDCEDFITLLKADFKIGKDVLYMIVDELEGDSRSRQYFGLN